MCEAAPEVDRLLRKTMLKWLEGHRVEDNAIHHEICENSRA
jgi:hypothetical protein